jgi:quinoprotein dehydrogenase-associated probable ABC transporter substrate-binding protein
MSSGSRQPLVALAAVVVLSLMLDLHTIRSAPVLRLTPLSEAASSTPVSQQSVLRVCADPNNMPFSNNRGEGFENRLAKMLAADMHAKVAYTWWPQRRGFIRNTLSAKRCDLVIGVPADYELVSTTAPYYRSTYVFITRRSDHLRISGFDDERLRTLRIGLHTIGDDYSNVPPAEALASRGMYRNVRGYPIYGDYSQSAPVRAPIDALVQGDIDVAIVWGPIAGYFVRGATVPLDMVPVMTPMQPAHLPMQFSIAMGVRRDDERLHDELEQILSRRRADIHVLLAAYGVPLVDGPAAFARAGDHPNTIADRQP